MIYRYQIILIDKLLKAGAIEDRLNAMGRESWELVQITDHSESHYVAIFRKEIEL